MKKIIPVIVILMVLGIRALGREAIYVEFRITGPSMTGTTTSYTSDGDIRSEMTMRNPSMPNPLSMVSLTLRSTPGKSYSLNEKDKTYSEMDVSKTHENDDEDYDITVLGKEKIGNYNSVHVSVRYKKSQHTMEMWLSKDVAGYANYTSVKNKYIGGAKFFNALKEKGAEGFVVRMLSTGEQGGKMQMDLVKVEKQNVSESMFSLNGYTKTAAMPGYGPGQQGVQNMTPEERKKYIEEMKAKYKR